MTVRPSRTPVAAADRDEEREKDMVTFRLGTPRRYKTILILGTAAAAARLFGWLPVTIPAILVIVGSSLALNFLLSYQTGRANGYRWWYRYAFATLDVLMISATVALLGNDSLVVLYFVAIIPYSFDRGRTLGYYTSILSTVLFIAASFLLFRYRRGALPLWAPAAAALLTTESCSSELLSAVSRSESHSPPPA